MQQSQRDVSTPSASDSRRPARAPHAALDHSSRAMKATKVVSQLKQERELTGTTILDVGCGGGVLANMLSRAVGPSGKVWAVDVVDQRTMLEGYTFIPVVDTTLPFSDCTFDIIVSNHCIEHVGTRSDQLQHLREIRRVLRDDGFCYLAAPSRWTLIEPHFKLPFLSWIPEGWRSLYVRGFGRGPGYDCDIPGPLAFGRLMRGASLRPTEVTYDAMRLVAQIERPGRLKKALLRAPRTVVRPFATMLPTRMYVLRKG